MPLTTGFENPLIQFDWPFWTWFASQESTEQIRILFAMVGWVAVALVFFYMGALLWVEYREQIKYVSQWQWVLLAVDIPPLYIQTPKAVEQIYAHLSGAAIHRTVGDKYWQGKKQKFFSLEIISIEGYIQFLIRTEIEFRDLVEAAIYAQYAEAEITEVEDYVTNIPKMYPNPDYDVMGLEFKLAAPNAYPIRTYPSFEYNISKDVVFSDPMAAILENFSRIAHGENLWMQIIIEPTDSRWKEDGINLVKKLMGQKFLGHDSFGSKVAGIPLALLREASNAWHAQFEASDGHDEDSVSDVNRLSPGLKATIEAIEDKITQVGFKSKIRALYAARKDVYNPSRCLDGFVGAMNQFHMQSRNAIIPSSKTHAHYQWGEGKTNRLKRRFVQRFQKRKIKAGATPYILNIEELATIWHFPLPFVKTPLVQKAGAKRAEPPMELPVETLERPLREKATTRVSAKPPPAPIEPAEEKPPEDLPYG